MTIGVLLFEYDDVELSLEFLHDNRYDFFDFMICTVSRHRNIMGLYDKKPQYPVDSFIAPSSSVIGEVSIGSQSSVWYNAVIRGQSAFLLGVSVM